MNGTDEDDTLSTIRDYADANGFNQVLGFTLEEVGDDWARARVPHDEAFVNVEHETAMHGGVAAASLDAVMGYAVMAAVHDDPERTHGPTINLNVNYVSTSSESLEAHGEILRLASQNAIVQGRIEGAETGKLVAVGQGVWRVFST